MTRLSGQVIELERLLKARGYDRYFLCNSAHPGRLKESLSDYLQTPEKDRTVAPLRLTTYSHWRDEDSPYVRCDFKMHYDPSTGFRVSEMQVTRANQYGILKSIELRPGGNNDIPSCEEANALMGQKRRSLKL
jgi:hypothetical protein